jgi:hypothetical protein
MGNRIDDHRLRIETAYRGVAPLLAVHGFGGVTMEDEK